MKADMPLTSSSTASGAVLALIFDLDGTLVHSLPDLTAALNRLLMEHDRPTVTEEAVAFMVGDGARMVGPTRLDQDRRAPKRGRLGQADGPPSSPSMRRQRRARHNPTLAS